ncbi:hypothetical protein [Rhizobium sp. L1K21]|uniref:hypothetical protein n=1 Tax=Rhizobium sp. L1K21 TaxID=2954933 RepID=UPI002092ADA8|nr:hypothetical protein [Rhizobium sp. L1K21]MCO6188488.1 hypothetical protein [Rhizobium sp. L1K21]
MPEVRITVATSTQDQKPSVFQHYINAAIRGECLLDEEVLGRIIPGNEDTLAEICVDFPTPQNPVLPLHLHPALLAGVAIVHIAGAEMLFMLRQSTFATNQTHFDHKTLPFLLNAEKERHRSPIQLI